MLDKLLKIKNDTTGAADLLKDIKHIVDESKKGTLGIEDLIPLLDNVDDLAEFLDGGINEMLEDVETTYNKANTTVGAIVMAYQRNPKKTIGIGVVILAMIVGQFFGIDFLAFMDHFAEMAG